MPNFTPNYRNIDGKLTSGGRKYVNLFDDDASRTYTEYLPTLASLGGNG